jgi:hypothetical protein
VITYTAADVGSTGYNFLHGFGVVGGRRSADRLSPERPVSGICRRHPWLCERLPELCRRYPALCQRLNLPPAPPGPQPPESGVEAALEEDEAIVLAYFAGLDDGRSGRDSGGGGPPLATEPPATGSKGCGCC